MENTKYILVDYENVQKIDIKKINENVKMLVFVGANQKNIPAELVEKTQPKGENIQWIMIKKSGKNAADFLIAYHLGTIISLKQTEFFIYSKDKGFDALVEFIKSKNKKVRRIENFNEINSCRIVLENIDNNLEKVMNNLEKVAEKKVESIPATIETLSNSIKSWLKTEDENETKRVISCLKEKKIISEENEKITYNGK
jgi:hypothetical protein